MSTQLHLVPKARMPPKRKLDSLLGDPPINDHPDKRLRDDELTASAELTPPQHTQQADSQEDDATQGPEVDPQDGDSSKQPQADQAFEVETSTKRKRDGLESDTPEQPTTKKLRAADSTAVSTSPVKVHSDATTEEDRNGTKGSLKRKYVKVDTDSLSDEPAGKKLRATDPADPVAEARADTPFQDEDNTEPLVCCEFPKKTSFLDLSAEIRKKIYGFAYDPATDHIKDFKGLILSCRTVNLDVSRENGEFVKKAAKHYAGRIARRMTTHFSVTVRFAPPKSIADLGRPRLLLPRRVFSLERKKWPKEMNARFKRAIAVLKKWPVDGFHLGFHGTLSAHLHFNFDARQQERLPGVVLLKHVLATDLEWGRGIATKRHSGWKEDAIAVLEELYLQTEIQSNTPDQYDMFNIWRVTTDQELLEQQEVRNALDELTNENLLQYAE